MDIRDGCKVVPQFDFPDAGALAEGEEPTPLTLDEERAWADRYRAIPRDATHHTTGDGTLWEVWRDWRVIVKHAKGTPPSVGRYFQLSDFLGGRRAIAVVWDTESDDAVVLRGRDQFAQAVAAIDDANKSDDPRRQTIAEAFTARHATVYFTPDRMLNVAPDKPRGS